MTLPTSEPNDSTDTNGYKVRDRQCGLCRDGRLYSVTALQTHARKHRREVDAHRRDITALATWTGAVIETDDEQSDEPPFDPALSAAIDAIELAYQALDQATVILMERAGLR